MWKLQDAKQRFSELVERALHQGPQVVTRRGLEVAVLVSMEQYKRLLAQRRDVKQYLLGAGPDFGELDLQRARDLPRPVDL